RKETKHARVEDERGSAGPPRANIQEKQADIAAASPSELLHLARHVRRVRSADGEEMEILVDREADRDVAPELPHGGDDFFARRISRGHFGDGFRHERSPDAGHAAPTARTSRRAVGARLLPAK